MLPSATEYHLKRAQMERHAAARATCSRSRTTHLQMADLHQEHADGVAVLPDASDLVPA